LEAARQSNAYNTRKAYLNLLAAQGLAKAADASLSRVRLIGEDTGNLYESGLADSVNLLEADLALERALQTQDERSTAVQNAKAFLARLVGLAPDTIGVIDSVPTPDISMYLNLPPQRESIGRAELRAQDSRVKAANFAISLSRANYYPTLNGFGGYSYGKPNKDMFQNKWNDYWTAGLNLNWDFNLGNRTGKNISSAKQAANSALAAREDLEEALYLQASTAYDNLLLSFRSYQISGRQFEIAKKQYALGQQKQQAGSLALNRLLELEADLSSSEQLYQVSTINFYISETEYLYAIGSPRIYGGFQR
jgi:outer membrane protein TolC